MTKIVDTIKNFIYLDENETREPRTIGLSMIPGQHVVSIEIDEPI